jgi:fatty acid desaturase
MVTQYPGSRPHKRLRLGRGAAGVWWPIRSSKPAGRSSPPVGWFDSIAAPSLEIGKKERFATTISLKGHWLATLDATLGADSRKGSPYRPYRDLLPPGRVRELSRLRPARAIVDTGLCWAAIVTAWVAAASWTRPWVVALAFVVVGTRYYALFILGHDGMHRRLLPGRRANDLFNDLLCLGPIGAVTHINNRNHLLHHRHLSTEDDPDRHRHCCRNKATRPAYLAFLTGLANVVPAVANVFVHNSGAGSRRRYSVRDISIILGWQAVLASGLTIAVGWWAYPVLWLAPVYVFTYLADMLRSFLEHSHPEADERADEHRLITYESSRLERLFFAPMNMNYHTAHHLWPSIPYYNLPVADRELKGHYQSDGLVWRGSYLAYLARYYLALPLPECKPA